MNIPDHQYHLEITSQNKGKTLNEVLGCSIEMQWELRTADIGERTRTRGQRMGTGNNSVFWNLYCLSLMFLFP